MYPSMQVQIGIWFLTLQMALTPQVPGHGSMHLFLWHALLEGQSELTTHSGLHATYGSPKYSGMHWQDPAPFRRWQLAFDPHGDGLQGSICSVGTLGGAKNLQYLGMECFKNQAYVLFFCNKHWKDHPCSLGRIDNLDSDYWQSKLHELHKLQDMGLCIFGSYMPSCLHILGLWYIQVCIQYKDFPGDQADICKRLHHSFRYIRHWCHMVMVCMDQ